MSIKPIMVFGACLVCALLVGGTALAEITLPAVFNDHMVLQRGVKAPIWGTAAAGDHIIVTLGEKRAATVAGADGKWQVALGPLPVGGPYTLTVKSNTQTRTVADVLVGEVWLCSGQSNMQFGLSSAANATQAISEANIPTMRLSDGKHWSVCTPDTAKNYSAITYFFGRALQAKLQVPVGLITNALGGSPADAWISPETLKTDLVCNTFSEQPWEHYLQAWKAAPEGKKPYPSLGPDYIMAPATLFEQRIRPLIPFAIKGVLWYQGESNAWGFQIAQVFSTEFPAMIRDWRRHWGKNFTFLIIQLPSYDGVLSPNPLEVYPWVIVQEAQARAAHTVPNAGLIAIPELGEKDIHPLNKLPVGERAALAARAVAYKEKGVEYTGPVFKSVAMQGKTIRVRFAHTAGGLTTIDGKAPQGFTVAGEDRRQYWAQAVIEGDTVLLTCPQVKKVVSVRYNFSENSPHNLANKIGLTAAPFRTDDWPWDTPARTPRSAQCIRATQAPVLDGSLADTLWKNCPVQTAFTLLYNYQVSAYPTEARFAYDNTNLYVGLRCGDNNLPGVQAQATTHDDEKIWQDDAIELLLDTARDKRTFRRILINPAGVTLDGAGFNNDIDGVRLLNQETLGDWRGFDTSWNGAYTVHTSRENNAWTVELAIRWTTLGVPAPTAGAAMGLQLFRYHANPEERSEWITSGRDYNTGAMMPGNRQIQSPARFGVLTFE